MFGSGLGLFTEVVTAEQWPVIDVPTRFSPFFGKLLEIYNLRNPKLVLYSTRHTFRDAMRRAGIDERTQDHFFGHEGSGVREVYGFRQPQAWQSALIKKITYPGLDLGRAPSPAA